MESINDPCIVTLAVNPKEYFELFMNYENYAERIKPLDDFESFSKPKTERKKVVRFTVKKGDMTTNPGWKDYVFANQQQEILFSWRCSFAAIRTLCIERARKVQKKKKGQKIENFFLKKKEKLLDLERQALVNCPKMELQNRILLQNFKVVHKNDPTTYLYNPSNQNVLEFILKDGRR